MAIGLLKALSKLVPKGEVSTSIVKPLRNSLDDILSKADLSDLKMFDGAAPPGSPIPEYRINQMINPIDPFFWKHVSPKKRMFSNINMPMDNASLIQPDLYGGQMFPGALGQTHLTPSIYGTMLGAPTAPLAVDPIQQLIEALRGE